MFCLAIAGQGNLGDLVSVVFGHFLDGGVCNVIQYHMPMVMIVLRFGIEFVRERGCWIVLHFHGGFALIFVRGALSRWGRRWCVASRCVFCICLFLVCAIGCEIALDSSGSGVVFATLRSFRPRWNMAILTMRGRSFCNHHMRCVVVEDYRSPLFCDIVHRQKVCL